VAYNTKAIKTDLNGKPVPQHFNASADDYEVTQGADNKTYVRASELETLIGALAAAAVTDPAVAASVIAALKGVLTDLGQISDAATTAGGTGSVSAKLRVMSAAIGALADAAVVDPAVSASVIAALKGLLTDIGQTSDAVAAAGAVGSLSAKLRRLTTDLDALLTKVGEVVSSPTANTILARLKDIKDGVQGPAAHDAAASGNPVQAGGVYRVADPALADGDVGSVRVNSKGEQLMQLTGSIESTTTAPVVGIKTITATVAEVFAGASAKASRRKLIIKNEDQTLRFRIGPSSATQQNGFPVEPGAVIEIQFDPATAVPFYVISEGANLSVAVMEI